MNHREALDRARQIIKQARIRRKHNNFRHFAETVADVVRDYTGAQRDRRPWLQEWAEKFRELVDTFEHRVDMDPMLMYEPRNKVCREFHKSTAQTRYFRAGNRTSKTTSGYAEDYFTLTGHHPYRDEPSTQASVIIVAGQPLKDYAPKTFEKKLLYGEDRNSLSPMFPDGGKWFYHYDKAKKILTLACPECAEAGTAGLCPGHHTKVTISLTSYEQDLAVIEAFTVRKAHIDEHVPEKFFNALKMRIADQPGGNIIVTGTPLQGINAWEISKLAGMANGPKEKNTSASGIKLVSLHQCTMYEGNVVDHDYIKDLEATMDEWEVDARVNGIPTPLGKNPVFDRDILRSMRETLEEPERGSLSPTVALEELAEPKDIDFVTFPEGTLRIWEKPVEGAQYIIGVDSAAGLTGGDASCAQVMRLGHKNQQLTMDQVAMFHGWLNPLEYGEEVFKLAVYYNSALVVVELTGGLGRAVQLKLTRELFYWNIFRDTSKPEFAEFGQDSRLGVDTNPSTKPFMVSVLQQFVKKRLINVRDDGTLQEMLAFEQERETAHGQALMTPRYRGARGSPDDRVMALAILAGVVVSSPVYDFDEDLNVT